ncbi:hypothetical protein NDU88_002535 [Pleurodeles waltl]|uniref:Uncharacterized protein n=1 Tax=Pleurodeles waltl TaxID=8319 RepID=A0AAV7UXC2_PLEWA|nr:hypothetical protein NDU88_002535 [Pleurodeles waltl]
MPARRPWCTQEYCQNIAKQCEAGFQSVYPRNQCRLVGCTPVLVDRIPRPITGLALGQVHLLEVAILPILG